MKATHHIFIAGLILLASVCQAQAQVDWHKVGNGPVLPRDTTWFPPSNDLIANSDVWVIREGGLYKMWYTCGGANYPADTLLRSRICYCTSADGIVWDKYAGNPVMDVSYGGAWDSLGVETITVIIDSSAPAGERYKAWYAGQYFNEYRYDIGYAWSADGMVWNKYGSPVLTVGAAGEWDNGFLEGPSVIKDGNTYKMWYAAYDINVDGQTTDGRVNIGYATSANGVLWTKYPGNPVFSTSLSGWDMLYVQDPHVIKRNGIYHMWYGGLDSDTYGGFGQQTGYAWSADGISWTRSPLNPVLSRGGSGDWDHNLASFPSVLFEDDGSLKMWYTGRDRDSLPANLNYYWESGLAIDTLGISFMAHYAGSQDISFFPNPVDEFVTLSFSSEIVESVLYIYDLQGRMLMKERLTHSPQFISTASLPAGYYTLRVCGHGAAWVGRMVKVRD